MTKRENILCLFERQKPELDKKIADGIERYRKGDALIRVTDAEGRPITYNPFLVFIPPNW